MIVLDRVPFPDFFVAARRQAAATLESNSTPLIPRVRNAFRGRETMVTNVLLIIFGLGLVPLAKQGGAARRSLALPFAGLTGYVLATVFTPYLYVPQRYIAYTLPLFIVVLLPASGAALAGVLWPARRAPWTRVVGVLLTAGASLVLLGGRGDPSAGYSVVLNPETKMYEFVRSLPKDALIAGWPGGVIDNVPYVCRRRAFMTRENHLTFQKGYVLEMRRRIHALMIALFSDDARGLLELRDTFDVTHLIVEAEYLSKPPPYFVPFDIEVGGIWQEGHLRGFAVETALAKAAVFSEGTLTVLDLSKP